MAARGYFARRLAALNPYLWWRLGAGGLDDQGSGNTDGAINAPFALGNAAGLLARDEDAASTPTTGFAFAPFTAGQNGIKSIGAWGRPDNVATNPVLAWTQHTDAVNVMVLQYLGTGAMRAAISTNVGGVATAVILDVAGAAVSGERAFFVMTYDQTRLRLYKNGVLIGSTAAVAPLWAPGSTRFIVNYPGFTMGPTGRTDEAFAFTRVLDPVEIADLYDAGAKGRVTARVVAEPEELMASIDTRDGNVLRCAGDEEATFDMPTQIGCETELPGGFGPGEIVLPRPNGYDSLEATRLLRAKTRIYDRQDRTVHEGRVVGTPQVGANEIEIQLEGPAAHLSDDETARLLGVDRDLSQWGGPSRATQIASKPSGWEVEGGSVTRDPTTGVPSITQPTSVGDSGLPWVINIYDAKGLGIGRLYYAWNLLAGIGFSGSYGVRARLGTDGNFTTTQDASIGATSGSGVLIATAGGTKKTFAYLDWFYSASSVGWGPQHAVNWSNIAVHGDHGLQVRGPDPGGYYVSDLAPYIVGKFAPQIQIAPDSQEATAFVIPHFVYLEDTTARDMVEALALFGGNSSYPLDWGVYDDWTWFMRSPGTYGNKWRSRRDDGAEPRDAGPDAAERINGVKLTYDDGTGTSRSVGPPGSGATLETALLLDSDPSNPANRSGARHWKRFDAGISSPPAATLLGQLILAEKNRQEWRGDMTLRGEQMDEAGNRHPAYMVRAGDTDALEDDEASDYRRIVGTNYAHDANKRENAITIGADPDRFDVLLAKAGVTTADLG